MRVMVSGSTGLVGKALCLSLEEKGHDVVRLVRGESGQSGGAVRWDPEGGVLPAESLTDIDAIVHLAGEPIAAGRWNAERKARIRDSRVNGTALVAKRIAEAGGRPPVLVSASALGIYGDKGDEVVTEEAPSGEGFLADVCRAWEEATVPASEAGARVVNLRIGIVLAADGGALEKMLPPFRLGMGGPLGKGEMWMSWIHLEDMVRAIEFALETPGLQGPVNAFAPNPVTNKDFTKTLGGALNRPAILPVPPFALRLALGEMADALLLSSVRGKPARLLESGFEYTYPDLEPALQNIVAS